MPRSPRPSGRRAHPRRRGEHVTPCASSPCPRGSSPQARGALHHQHHHPRRRGLIPAGAGSTSARSPGSGHPPAHPRRRGEHSVQVFVRDSRSGSSPQARGARGSRRVRPTRWGLIPAGAGSTLRRPRGPRCGAAHPRRRGEHLGRAVQDRWVEGSSPQARGARVKQPLQQHRVGLIPAGAGSTGPGQPGCATCTAHPRRRGEHCLAGTCQQPRPGSSPQARGALPLHPATREHAGLIPAGAGSTSPPAPPCAGSWAHPRRRGEHVSRSASIGEEPGSSPQARGAPADHRASAHPPGLIPAGAGSTTGHSMNALWCAAHPRRRGEHNTDAGSTWLDPGSSPQARGARTMCRPGVGGPVAHPRRRGEHDGKRASHVVRHGSSPQARGARPAALLRGGLFGLIPAGAGSTCPPSRPCASGTAHPRRRGEHVFPNNQLFLSEGSSPQARGALTDALWCTVVAGLIPAGAGST